MTQQEYLLAHLIDIFAENLKWIIFSLASFNLSTLFLKNIEIGLLPFKSLALSNESWINLLQSSSEDQL